MGRSSTGFFRLTGLTGNPGTPVARIPTSLGTSIPDTVYTDRGLNTTANPYRYKIVVYYTAGGVLTPLDSTESASSVRLAAQGAVRSINLSWQFNVPWKNSSYRVFPRSAGPAGYLQPDCRQRDGDQLHRYRRGQTPPCP